MIDSYAARNDPYFLRNGFETSGKYSFPLIKKQEVSLEKIALIPYNLTKSNDIKNADCGVHFFIDDYRFFGVYDFPEKAFARICGYKFLLSPDFSLYKEMPMWKLIENIGKSRWCGAYWQSKGKTVIPTKPIRPFVSQAFEDQSYAVGGLARLDVVVNGKASVVGYFSRSLPIHRGKLSTADVLWQKHLNEMLVPCVDTSLLTMHTYHAPMISEDKMDVVIHGLGWFCISGAVQDVYVRVHKGIQVSFRKAMI